MTYESAKQWAEKNIPMAEYDSFEEWYAYATEEFETPKLTDNEEFKESMRDAWNKVMPETPKRKERHITEYEEQPPMPVTEETKVVITPEPIQEPIREIPPTGKAPVITTRQIDMTPPKKEVRLSRLRRFFRFKRGNTK